MFKISVNTKVIYSLNCNITNILVLQNSKQPNPNNMTNTLLTNVKRNLGNYCVKNNSKHEHNFQIKKTIFTFSIAFILLFTGKNYAQSESFDSGIPATWTLFNNAAGNIDWQPTTDGYINSGVSVNPSADNIGDQSTARYYLVSPQLTVPTNGEIQFYTKQASAINNGAQYEVRLSTAAQPDINGFNVVLQTYTENNLNVGSQTTYEKKVIELPEAMAGLNIYIAFVAVNTQNGVNPTGDEWFVDEFSILEGCTEINLNDIIVSNITVDQALVSWTHPEATNFQLQVMPTGGVPAATGVAVSGNSFPIQNLDEATEYDIYISALCNNATQSGWVGPITFETLKYGLSCEYPIVVPDVSVTPYILADNLANFSNPSLVYTTQGSNCISGNSTSNYLNSNKIFLSYTPTQDGLLTLTQTTFDGGSSADNCWNARSSLLVYDSCANVGVQCIAGTNTTNGFDPKSISNLLVQTGETYIIVISSELALNAGICFELEITSPTCAPPSEIIFNSLTENSVVFSWDNIGNFASSWEYAVVPTGTGAPLGPGIPTNTNSNNLINTGLTSAGTYDLYVRAVCGGTPGIWSNPTTFTTQCATLNTPYTTSFSNATNANPEPCWTTIDANNDGIKWSFIGGASGAGYATVLTSTSQNENHDLYISPRINFDGLIQKRLRYKHRATQGTSTYTVKLSTTGAGTENFTTILLPETQITTTSFQEVTIDIPIEIVGEVNIAWIVEPNTTENAFRFSIDDIVIEDKPSCPVPTNLFVLNSSITTTSAWLFWTAGESETQWELAIQDLNSGVPTGSGQLVSTNAPYMATNLEPGTRYEFYVRAYCQSDDQSEWVGPIAFNTKCISYNTPFFESFDDDDIDTQKFCWNISNGNWYLTETTAKLNSGSSYNDYLISPAINVNGAKELKFKYRAETLFNLGAITAPRFGLEVVMSTTNANPSSFTTVLVPFETFTHSGYIEKSVIIEANGPVYIAFRVPPQFSGSASRLNIDDVSITDAPECPIPGNLNVATITTTTAELTWTTGYQESSWNVVVQPAGTGIPTQSDTLVNANNYSANDLTPDTEYEFYVQSVCTNGVSEWFGPLNFKTSCLPYPTPFVETFDSDSVSDSCWIVVDENDDFESWNTNNSNFVFEGDQAAAIFTGSNGQNDDWLISPTITLTANQRLRFYYRALYNYYIEDLEVLLSTNGINLSQFTTVLYDSDDDSAIINNEEYRVKIVDLQGITGNVNIAFRVPFYPSTGSYRGNGLFIDNVIIEDKPECTEVTNVSVNINTLTDTTMELSWDNNDSTQPWQISVQPAGTLPPVGATDPNYLYTATTNPFTITELTASTMYDVYVRAECNGTFSQWSEPLQVVTKCPSDNLCQYKFVLKSDSNVSAELQLTQNNQVVQFFPFNGNVNGDEFIAYLCNGVEFSLYFWTIGSNAAQYANYQFDIYDSTNNLIYSSPTGLIPRRNVFTSSVICGDPSCPQPTNLTINAASLFSWTAGGSETQWEVAVQPVENGTIPQSGTIVNTTSYTPINTDFTDPTAATYEYFVRAICSENDNSYWSGPFIFVRNDSVLNAITIPINETESCNEAATKVSFINASVSFESMSCEGTNYRDVWFDFTAESVAHIIKIKGFDGNFYYTSGDIPFPAITMTLYKNNSGTLEEMACSYDNVLLGMYSNALEIGSNYKLRLTLNSNNEHYRRFDVCITTPTDPCSMNLAINGGFEEPVSSQFRIIQNISTLEPIPGWQQNLNSNNNLMFWLSMNGAGFYPYEGGQCVQLVTENEPVDLSSPDIRGLYRDFDTSEATLMEYSFAHYARFEGNNIQLFVGAPGGPYTLLTENEGGWSWQIISGEYQIPSGQDVTRIIFRAAGGSANTGNLLDDVRVSFNNEITTDNLEIDCNTPTATIQANGVGTWIPSTTNPGTVTIDNANSNNANISGFVQSGVYSFTWQTRYCEDIIQITYNGVSETPTVVSPVNYCLNETTEPLTASSSSNYTLIWHTQAVGGTGSTTAPIPSTNAVGNTSYFVAYQDSTGCEGPRAEIVVTVNDVIIPELNFSYATTCTNANQNPLPTLTTNFSTGGIFSATTLTVNASTGEVDLSTATDGTHNITYTFTADNENCISGGSNTVSIEIIQSSTPVTDFTYAESSYCPTNSNPMPILNNNFATGGTFSAENGLAINQTTGEINISASTVGSYIVVYEILNDETNCIEGNISTFDIVILDSIEVEITGECIDNDYVLTANGSFNENDATYTWTDVNGTIIGSNSNILNITEFTAENPLSLPAQLMVTVNYGDCNTTASFKVERSNCNIIPRGISPNGDGKNDSLDLTGYGVTRIFIYNRYGKEVYNFNGNYTNQWHGQTNDGNDLPDGTYFYSIAKNDGNEIVGWIYINKEH